MKVAIIQNDPIFKEVERNMENVSKMLSGLDISSEISIVILPEMAFTGYTFNSKDDIRDVLEFCDSGKTYSWCQREAMRLKSIVACGYPETTRDGRLFNSMMVISPEGNLMVNVRKSFLYETDKHWAEEGDGFKSIYCPWLKKTIAFGICMDINPYDFVAPFTAYEFAHHVLNTKSDLIIFSAAWLDPNCDSNDPLQTIRYWISRLAPVVHELNKSQSQSQSQHDQEDRNCHFLCANRIGREGETKFVGSSCVVDLAKLTVLDYSDTCSQKLLVVDLASK